MEHRTSVDSHGPPRTQKTSSATETVTHSHAVSQADTPFGQNRITAEADKRASETHFRCSEALLVLVGDTGIEPVTSSVSGINTVLNNSPLSTKTVRERPVISTNIRGRCHAISHADEWPYTSGRPTPADHPFGQLRRGSGKPRLVYPGARLAREEASTPVAMSW